MFRAAYSELDDAAPETVPNKIDTVRFNLIHSDDESVVPLMYSISCPVAAAGRRFSWVYIFILQQAIKVNCSASEVVTERK